MDYIKSSNRSQIEMYNLDDQIEKDNTVRFVDASSHKLKKAFS